MELLYYNGLNFGDQLNPYIFYSLFDAIELKRRLPNYHLLGVGSILSPYYFRQIDKHETGLVFGAGIRNENDIPPVNINSIFVRGPLSAKIHSCPYISDAAYLLGILREYQSYLKLPKSLVTLIPYYNHIKHMDWNRISEITGFNILLPTLPPHTILSQIASSKLVISGAMHGCIAADILRVPWIRMRFNLHEADDSVQTLKWTDWAASIKKLKHKTLHMHSPNLKNPDLNKALEKELIETLSKSDNLKSATLSEDIVYAEIKDKLCHAVHDFSKKFSISINKYRTNM